MRIAYHGIIIQKRRILMLDKRGSYILPGGKPKEGESPKDCIKREIEEELSKTKVRVGDYYDDFEGLTPHSKRHLVSKTYFCYVDGKVGEPSAEISSKVFINSRDKDNFNLLEISKKTLDSLIDRGLID